MHFAKNCFHITMHKPLGGGLWGKAGGSLPNVTKTHRSLILSWETLIGNTISILELHFDNVMQCIKMLICKGYIQMFIKIIKSLAVM